jgi:hypothetical protein
MRITVGTDILVRAVVRDDEKQAEAAAKLLKEAEVIAVSLPCLCEFVWVCGAFTASHRRIFPLHSMPCWIPAMSR